MAHARLFLSYCFAALLAGCDLPPPSSAVVYVAADGGLVGNGTGDGPLALAGGGSCIENRGFDVGPQNAGFNLHGSGALSGRLSVGLPAPKPFAARLHLESDGTWASGLLIGEAAPNDPGLSLWYDGRGATNTYIDSRYDHDGATMSFRMRTHGMPVDALTILGNGNIGIGTPKPNQGNSGSRVLTISTDPVGGHPGIELVGVAHDPGNWTGEVTFFNGAGQRAAQMHAQIPEDPIAPEKTVNPNRGVLAFSTSAADKSLVERMRFDSDGNVGIGTAAPKESLQVVGNIRATESVSGAGGKVFVGGSLKGTVDNGTACPLLDVYKGPLRLFCDSTRKGAITYDDTLGTDNGHFYGCRGIGGNGYCWVQLDN